MSGGQLSLEDLFGGGGDDLVGRSLSHVRVERRLGRGGMGEVYLGQASMGPRVIKVLAPEVARDPMLLKRLEREWAALAQIRPPHPNVVEVFAIALDHDPPHLVLEFVEGHSLLRLVQERGRLDPALAAAVARDVARGLEAVHAVGLIHRDVKPANVMVTPWGGAKLIDFGIAKDQNRSALTLPGQLVGSAPTMAPEQWDPDAPVDARCDLFALGVTLYQALAGRLPFRGDDVEETANLIAAGDYPPLDEVAPHVPGELALVVARLLLPEPNDRYPTARVVAEDLDAVLAGGRARIPCLQAPNGFRFPLLPGRRFTVGRDPSCAVRIDHPSVAPKHAQLRREPGGGLSLRALKGAPVAVGGAPLQRAHRLRHGERVRFGEVELTYSG